MSLSKWRHKRIKTFKKTICQTYYNLIHFHFHSYALAQQEQNSTLHTVTMDRGSILVLLLYRAKSCFLKRQLKTIYRLNLNNIIIQEILFRYNNIIIPMENKTYENLNYNYDWITKKLMSRMSNEMKTKFKPVDNNNY